MATTATVTITNNGKPLVKLLKTADGYLSSAGVELANFTASARFVNGLTGDENVFNGMGCFAAQLIAHLKTKAGLWYVADLDTDYGDDYTYTINGGLDAGNYKPTPVTMTMTTLDSRTFSGSPEEFITYLSTAK